MRPSHKHHRRGIAIAVMVVIVSVLALAIAGSIRPLRDEADTTRLRVETLRAFYAAESGTAVLLTTLSNGVEPPESGESLSMGVQTVRFVTVPDSAGTAVVEGASGDAVRRVELEIQ